MNMREWRTRNGYTLAKAAEIFGLENARAYHRYETGENRPDAHIADRILRDSDGAIELSDLHQQRLEWLRTHRPELLGDEAAA